MKKTILTLVAALAALLPFTAGAQTVTVGSPSVRCGETVDVPVTISSVSGLQSLEFTIGYSTSKLQFEQATTGSFTSGFQIAANDTGGSIKVALITGNPASGSGRVATLRFAAGGSATGSADITISDILVNDVAKSGVDGSVTITCPQPPDAPGLVSPANNASNVNAPVTLQWNAVGDAENYLVYFGTPNPSSIGSTSSTSMEVETATGTTYQWYVIARNEAGTSGPSATRSFTTSGPFCATPASSTLSAPASATSGSQYTVSWSAAANATEYVLEEATNAAFTGATATTTTATAASFTKSVSDNTTFYYRVRTRNTSSGCNATGNNSATAAVVVTPKPPIPAGGAVLVVVGSAPGNFGAMFRTALQLHNPTSGVLRGRIVFHPAGASGSDNDPFLAYELQPGQTIAYDDLLPAMGLPPGLGSVDIVPDPGHTLPLFVTRVFNDAGEDGTSGMTLDRLGLDDILYAGERGVIVAPADPARMRMNIGIRALSEGASITVVMRDSNGTVVASKDLSYPPVYFSQNGADALMGAPLPGNGSLTFTVNAGSALIYGSTTDNVTNDPNVQIARVVE